MAPEFVVLTIIIVLLSFAYLVAYPLLRVRTLGRLAAYDLVMVATLMIVVGGLFWKTGTRFNLLLFHVNWFWFALIACLIIEWPLMMWYARRHNIDMTTPSIPKE